MKKNLLSIWALNLQVILYTHVPQNEIGIKLILWFLQIRGKC